MWRDSVLLQELLLLTDLYGDHPSRVLGPTLVYTSRIWPVTALHPMLKCHPALLHSKSHSLWRFLRQADLPVAATVAPLELVSVNVHVVARAGHWAAGGF